MKKELDHLKKECLEALQNVNDSLKLDEVYQRFFSRRSGKLSEIMKNLKDLSGEARVEMGKFANEVKTELEDVYGKKKKALAGEEIGRMVEQESIDITQPQLPPREKGHLHPITQALWQLEDTARGMGFIIEDGPEIESEYYVFDALNIPLHHPARDVQDTFYLKGMPQATMRSHVSGMQVRQMRMYGAPLRAVHCGRVFRNEALDATHGHTFYQFDCIVVDKGLSIAHMVGVIKAFLEGLYNQEIELRLRPSYFPFVEPAIEIEMKITTGVGDARKTKWVEIVGSGPVHPNVIRAGGLDPDVYDGFAFSFGLDRLVMRKFKIEDIRHIHSGDLRFLEQF